MKIKSFMKYFKKGSLNSLYLDIFIFRGGIFYLAFVVVMQSFSISVNKVVYLLTNFCEGVTVSTPFLWFCINNNHS